MIGSIDPNGYSSIYSNSTYSKVNDLSVGHNPQKFVCVKIVSVVSHSDIPL